MEDIIDKNKSKANLAFAFILVVCFVAFAMLLAYGGVANGNVIVNNNDSDVKVISVDSLNSGNISFVDKNISQCYGEINEVVSKRTYNSQTFKNKDGSFSAQLYSRAVFFYDGNCYVKLDQVSNPNLVKKEFTLYGVPLNSTFNFGSYILHNGINVSLENNTIVLKDAEDNLIKTLPQPYSIDSNGNVSVGLYKINLDNDNLSISVLVDHNWLENAKYPVMVDPTVQLDNSTGVYDAMLTMTNLRLRGGDFDQIGNTGFDLFNGVLEFNTSTIPTSSTINQIILNLSVDGNFVNAGSKMNFTRFNNSMVSDNVSYPTNLSGNYKLYVDVWNGTYTGGGFYLTGLTDFQSSGNKTFNLSLNSNANTDLKNQLGLNGYFALGVVSNLPLGPTELASFYNANGAGNLKEGPRLFVYYSSNCPSTCTYSGSGDWCVNQTCSSIASTTAITGDLYIQDVGVFNMSGVGVNFSGSNRHIYVYKGGQLILNHNSLGATGFDK